MESDISPKHLVGVRGSTIRNSDNCVGSRRLGIDSFKDFGLKSGTTSNSSGNLIVDLIENKSINF